MHEPFSDRLANTLLNLRNKEEKALYRKWLIICTITIFYKFIEGVIAVWIGGANNHLSLYGYGIHSGIGILSSFGIICMILYQKRGLQASAKYYLYFSFRIAGIGFYVVSARLLTSIIWYNVAVQVPITTVPGICVAIASAVFIGTLYRYKAGLATKYSLPPLLIDVYAHKNSICMACIVLISSIAYYLFPFDFIDVIGRAGLTFFTILAGSGLLRRSKEVYS